MRRSADPTVSVTVYVGLDEEPVCGRHLVVSSSYEIAVRDAYPLPIPRRNAYGEAPRRET